MCGLGQLRSEEEHYIVLFESVQIPHTRDFLKKILPAVQKAENKASELMHYLLRQYHIPAAERNALSELEALPVCTDVRAFVAKFDSLAVRITDTFATDAGKAHMFLTRLPASVRTAGRLDGLLAQGWTCTQIQHEALRVVGESGAVTDVPAQPAVRFRAPTPEPAPPAVPEPMVLGAIAEAVETAVQDAVARLDLGARRGSAPARHTPPARRQGGGRGGGGRTPPREFSQAPADTKCLRCGGKAHWAWECVTPRHNGLGN